MSLVHVGMIAAPFGGQVSELSPVPRGFQASVTWRWKSDLSISKSTLGAIFYSLKKFLGDSLTRRPPCAQGMTNLLLGSKSTAKRQPWAFTGSLDEITTPRRKQIPLGRFPRGRTGIFWQCKGKLKKNTCSVVLRSQLTDAGNWMKTLEKGKHRLWFCCGWRKFVH